jgi:hypothetical protein
LVIAAPLGQLGDPPALDRPEVEHECTARVVGQFAGQPGLDRAVTFRMLHVFEFRDGLISRENVWMDAAGVAAQLAEAP